MLTERIQVRGRCSRTRSLLLAGLALVCLCSCGRNALVDERNVYYVRGMRLRDQKRNEEAAEAFTKCLRLSPASGKAHLQLALLYEGVLEDPLLCVYHYRMFLELRPEDPNAEVVQGWLTKAEGRLLAALQHKDGPSPTTARPAASPPPASAEEAAREGRLTVRIRELSRANTVLREKLDALLSQLQSQAEAVATASRKAMTPSPTEARSAAAADARAPAASPASDTAVRYHQVAVGDTLSSISRTYYGNLRYWPQLRDANREVLGGHDTLRVGMRLRIPDLKDLMQAP